MKWSLLVGIFVILILALASVSQGYEHLQKRRADSLLFENDEPLSYTDESKWWPMFQHDTKNSGFSKSNGPESNNIAWSFESDLKLYSPAVTNNRVFFGSESMDNTPLSTSYLYCLDLAGNLVWRSETTGDLDSFPAVLYNQVYISSDNGNMYCFDAENGTMIWEKRLDGALSSPSITDNNIVVESLDGNVYCLDSNSGEILWKTQLSIDVLSTPIIVDEQIFVRNYCLDLFTGDIIWSSDVGIVLLSSPTFFEDKVYIGSRDEKMYCLDATTGEKLWRFYTGSMTYETAPAVAYDNVYVGNAFGFIYCVNATSGERVWSAKESSRAVASPVLCDEKLYIGSVDNHLYCLDAFTGEKIWDFSSDDDFFSSLAIAEDHMFGVSGNTLFCFGENISVRSDLKCSDNLVFSEVRPNEAATSSFTISNIGEYHSQLQWRIESFPEWGDWSFNPRKGSNLTPSDSPIEVEVTVVAPNLKDETFSGEITIVNELDNSDVEVVEVVLTTNKKAVVNNSFFSYFVERWIKLRYLVS